MSDSTDETLKVMSKEEQQKVAECYTKTHDHYNELPDGCQTCGDYNVCLVLDTEINTTLEKGGD